MNSKKDLWLYLAILFILSYLWQCLIYFTGGIDSALFTFIMFFPGCIAAIFRACLIY